MPEYRAYLFGSDGHIIKRVELVCTDDEAAKEQVLLPGEEAAKAWRAFRAGNEAWQLYLSEIESQLTLAAFQKLSCLVVPEPDRPLALEHNIETIEISAPVELSEQIDIRSNAVVAFPTPRFHKPHDGGDDAA